MSHPPTTVHVDSERRVAWSDGSLAGLRWLHLAGERTAVFTKLGELASAEIHAVQEAMPERVALRAWVESPAGTRIFASLVEAAERDFGPELAELSALAAGAGLDRDDLLIPNLRGDVGVPDGTGCTDLALNGDRPIVAHNEDGAPALNGSFMFVTLSIDGDPTVTTQWYPGFMPCNAHAMTSTGVTWGINHIQVTSPATAAGRHFLARRIQRCLDFAEAVETLKTTPTAGGFAYTLGELGTGNIAIVETAAGHSHATTPKADSLTWHTNHLRWLPTRLDTSSGVSTATDSLGMRSESEGRGTFLETLDLPQDADAQWALGVLARSELPHGVRRTAADDDPLMTLMTTAVDLRARTVTLYAASGDEITLDADDYLRLDERTALQAVLND